MHDEGQRNAKGLTGAHINYIKAVPPFVSATTLGFIAPSKLYLYVQKTLKLERSRAAELAIKILRKPKIYGSIWTCN